MCLKPATRKDGRVFPCGQCINCRVNKKRGIIARCLLETTQHAASYFLTLTYDVPKSQVVGPYETYLSKYHVQCFFKRLGKEFGRRQFKYVVRGEYGTNKGRAHYHILLWADNPSIGKADFERIWGFGNVDIGDIEPASVDYVVDYLFKTPEILADIYSSPDGRAAHPDYRTFSQGIGARAVHDLAYRGILHNSFRLLGREYPVPRYLKLKYLRASSLTEHYYAHGSLPLEQKPEDLLEQKLVSELRSLPYGSPAYTAKREEIIQQKETLSRERQKLKQIAYYRSINQPVKGRKNETF